MASDNQTARHPGKQGAKEPHEPRARAAFGEQISRELVCAFFSTFTGASGATILALGGLLLPVLTQNGLSERFSIGLVTSTGSIGLLFPPSLAVILYGIVAQVPINDLYVAGIIPGVLMVLAVSLYGLAVSLRAAIPRPPFDLREAREAAWDAKWELMLRWWRSSPFSAGSRH